MAYDSESNRVVLFGGERGRLFGPLNKTTWSYDPMTNQWIKMNPPLKPSYRSGHDMVYDTESDQIIMFGGVGLNSFGERTTWTYDFNTDSWIKQNPGPPARQGGRMAYDTESDRIILFGGKNEEPGEYGNLLNDTWAYDFNADSWTEMKPSVKPPVQSDSTMTYDAESDRVLMWRGGYDDNIMWAYDFNTNTWTNNGTSGHPPKGSFGWMVYDSESDRSILYGGGGSHGSDTTDATWAYDYNTNTWTEMDPSENPGELTLHAMAYNDNLDLVILFGGRVGSGSTYTDETWSYDLNSDTWTNVFSP